MKSLFIGAATGAILTALAFTYCFKCCKKGSCSSESLMKKNMQPTNYKLYGFKYPFTLGELPYEYNALDPHIDEETMRLHHTKHHQAYVDNLNKALEEAPEYQKYTIEELLTNLDVLPASIKERVRNHGGGHFNHTLFWDLMTAQAAERPTELVAGQINKFFGSFDSFKAEFDKAALSRFGSGWAWLCVKSDKTLTVISTPNQDTPLAQGLYPILALDVWEHAYYIKYRNKRAEYVSAWWNVINWKHVEKLYHNALKHFGA